MAPVLLLLIALQAPAPEPDDIVELKRAYEQSCGQRAYGTFDDVCTQMGDQIRDREREAARAGRRRPAASSAPAPSPPPPAPAGPTGTPPAATR